MSASYNGAQELTAYNNNAVANMTAATYDGDSLRASASTTPNGGSSTTQNFTWDVSGSLPHLLMDSSNAYIYGPGNTPIEQVNLSTGTLQYLVPDLLGSVRGIVSSTGSLTATTSYDAWGNPQTTGGLATYTPIGFAGGYTDPTGLSYLIGRYYDPTTGGFISVDPLVDSTDQPYAYAGDNPIDNADPTGQLTVCVPFVGCASTHGFDPMASVDALVNIGRGATFGLTDTIANWISPGASCTVPQNSYDQALGGAASSLFAGDLAAKGLAWLGTLGSSAAEEELGLLEESEIAGGHTITRHVGLSDADLLARLAAESGIAGASTFSDLATAESSVADVLAENEGEIEAFLQGNQAKLVLNGQAPGLVGRYVAQGATDVVDVSGVRVVLQRDPALATGYRIQTAYPQP